VWRLHYAETLRHWRDRFEANIDKATAIYDERFCRMWRYYLAASEVSFRNDTHVVFQLQLSRKNNVVPLTRDYLYRPEAAPARVSHAAE
jgi:cyclopropane-fatty-acyl-phospholipid synthase